MTTEVQDALLKLSLKNGDIVFVDRDTIDPEAITNMLSPSPDQDDVIFILVNLRPGMTLLDSIRKASPEEIEAIKRHLQPHTR